MLAVQLLTTFLTSGREEGLVWKKKWQKGKNTKTLKYWNNGQEYQYKDFIETIFKKKRTTALSFFQNKTTEMLGEITQTFNFFLEERPDTNGSCITP